VGELADEVEQAREWRKRAGEYRVRGHGRSPAKGKVSREGVYRPDQSCRKGTNRKEQ
jgi:hypothetical protein